MVKRFEWPPSGTSTADGNEASQAVDRIKVRATQLFEHVQSTIVQRPAVMLPVAICAGVVLGWLIKRR